MKKQNSVYIALATILLASLACNFGSKVPSTEIEQEPTVVSQPTIVRQPTKPAATTVPTQEDVNNDGSSGPETIDLENPTLYITSSSPAYIFTMKMNFSGVDKTGTSKEVSSSMTDETQTLPKKSQHLLIVITGGKGSAETVVIGEKGYSLFQDTCFPFPASSTDAQNPSEGMPKLQNEITGQAKRVESRIDVNGFITDKYELTSENMVSDDELSGAFVYVTHDSGFITRFELQGRSKTDFQGLDPNQLTNIKSVWNYIPVEDGSLEIAIPAVCVK